MRASLGICQDALGLFIGSRSDLLGLSASLSQQRLTVGLGLLGGPARLVGLLHRIAHALRPRVEHADNWLEQKLAQQQEQDDEVDGMPDQAWPVQPQSASDRFHGSLCSQSRVSDLADEN